MQTVGEILRNEREKKGLSLKDIEAATSIRALYINAIEEDNYKIVPGEVYLKGFIRNYANYLGLDGQKMVDIYRQNQSSSNVSVPATPPVSEKPKTTESSPENEPDKPAKSAKWLGVGFLVLVAAGSFWWYSANKPFEPGPIQQTTPIQQATPAPVPPVQPTPKVQPSTDTTPTPPATTKPLVLTAKFTDECWILVTADGKTAYEGIPKTGESFTWEAQNSITIKAGNAGGVDFVYNGQPVGKIGGKGEVAVKTFSAKL